MAEFLHQTGQLSSLLWAQAATDPRLQVRHPAVGQTHRFCSKCIPKLLQSWTRSQPGDKQKTFRREETNFDSDCHKLKHSEKKDMELFGIFGVAQVLVTDWNPLTVYIWCEPQSFETVEDQLLFVMFPASWCNLDAAVYGQFLVITASFGWHP